MANKRYLFLAIFGFGIGLAVLFSLYHFQKPNSEVLHNQDSGIADIGGDFELIDQNGKLRSTKEFRGKLLMVYFGYTYCPDVCPMALEHITEALKGLGKDRDKVAVVFVSVDPERDTIDNLKLYSSNFDPNIIMLTGSNENLANAMKQYRVYVKKENKPGMSDYLLNHTSVVYLMGTDGKYLQGFAHSTKPEMIKSILLRNLQS
jgi:cytochrome oxidase Cu insertion factor (SCO1/SenC/PrrC family)